MLIDQHCKDQGLEIVGIYQATVANSAEMSSVKPIAEKVAANYPGASAWFIDSTKLAKKQVAMTGFANVSGEWKGISADAVGVTDEIVKHTTRLISDMKYLELVDFDDHLNDASASFLNTDLFKGDALGKLDVNFGTD